MLPSMIDVHVLFAGMDPGSTLASGLPSSCRALPTLTAGARLPSEELMGTKPAQDPAQRRAYLSNVCVAHSARRQVQGCGLHYRNICCRQ